VAVLKGLLRAAAFVLLAAGFVAAVMDGAQSLANGELAYAKLGATAHRLLNERFLLIQPALERHVHPLLWDPVMLNVLLLPTSLTLLALGLVLYRLGRRPAPAIGYTMRN
jgi:hypothetical protein